MNKLKVVFIATMLSIMGTNANAMDYSAALPFEEKKMYCVSVGNTTKAMALAHNTGIPISKPTLLHYMLHASIVGLGNPNPDLIGRASYIECMRDFNRYFELFRSKVEDI